MNFDEYWQARKEEADFRPGAVKREAKAAADAERFATLQEVAYKLRDIKPEDVPAWLFVQKMSGFPKTEQEGE